MDVKKSVREVQNKILEIMKYIDAVCRKNGIVYYIMGGTALGAIRHGGFIPWDDDLDIFMTPQEYAKFKSVMEREGNPNYVLQEWRTVKDYLEYAKVRMNGTTFIEENFKDRKNMHQGIYVDIMILHKIPESKFMQKMVYYESKFVTLYALSQRNWKPKNKGQAMMLRFLKFLPCQFISKICYRHIYKYDDMTDNFMYCYWITPAKFRSGLFDKKFFDAPIDIPFEDAIFYGSKHIKDYLTYRYGDYMKLPSIEQQRAAVHAYIFDTEKDYSEYIK
ncbi:MAG: LicD family protein [Bacteroidaceae bacterium]|nr:LicD family protein [Bacteroidaceae bacterium]